MATLCEVCQRPCRGRCPRCGARLCAVHKPATARSRCALCRRAPTLAQIVQAIPPYPGTAPASTGLPAPAGTPTRSRAPGTLPSASTGVALDVLTLPEQLAWIAVRRERLLDKQRRERAYLDGRGRRGRHTPVDDAYERDQILEDELCQALDLLARLLQQGAAGMFSGAMGPTSLWSADLLQFAAPDAHDKLRP